MRLAKNRRRRLLKDFSASRTLDKSLPMRWEERSRQENTLSPQRHLGRDGGDDYSFFLFAFGDYSKGRCYDGLDQ